MSQDIINKIIELTQSEEWLSIQRISEIAGCGYGTVARVLKKHNLQHNPKPKNPIISDIAILKEDNESFRLKPKMGQKINWNKPGLKEKIKTLISKNLTLDQIGEILGTTRMSVSRGIKRLGLIYKNKNPEYNWTEKKLSFLKSCLKGEKLTIPEIAKKLGTSVYVVRRAITRNNLHYNVSDIHKKNYLKFYKMFTKDKLSIEEISERTGFSKHTIYRRLLDEFKSRGEYHRLKQSLGERYTMGALNNLGVQFTREKMYTGLIKCKNYFRIDFEVILDGTKYWIEYNGEQHYREGRFYETMENRTITFKKQVERDIEVKEYAKNNDIVFIEIPYTITRVDKITSILSEILLKHKSPSEVVKLPKVEI